MNKELIEVQDIFLDGVNQICNKFGLNNIMAQLYAILYLNSKPLSFNDMVERLKISKASVSVNIRALERYNAVRRVWVKGSRKTYYEAEADIAKVIMDRVKSMTQNRISEIDSMINTSFRALSAVNDFHKDKEAREAMKVFKQRLEMLRKLQNKAQSLFNLFNSNLINNLLSAKANKCQKREAAILK